LAKDISLSATTTYLLDFSATM